MIRELPESLRAASRMLSLTSFDAIKYSSNFQDFLRSNGLLAVYAEDNEFITIIGKYNLKIRFDRLVENRLSFFVTKKARVWFGGTYDINLSEENANRVDVEYKRIRNYNDDTYEPDHWFGMREDSDTDHVSFLTFKNDRKFCRGVIFEMEKTR